jgi:hypothetical protein
MKSKKLKITLYVIVIVILGLLGVIFYYYQQGGVQNYVPPEATHASSKTQVVNDLTTLAHAIDAYYAMNLQYPDSLIQLQPDFVQKLPIEPGSGKMYIYKTDGSSKYTIGVPDPHLYQLKEFAIENGKVIEH